VTDQTPSPRAQQPVSAVRERGFRLSARSGPAEPRRPVEPTRSAGARAERRLGLLLVAPAALVMLAVTAYPILDAVWLSLQRYDLRFPGAHRFVWFGNYVAVLRDTYWWKAFGVTVGITAVSVAIEFVLGLMLALVMQRTLLGRGVVRTVVLIPYGIVTVAAAYSWYYAWTPGTGWLANLLPGGNAPLTQHWSALGVIVLAEVWKTTPFMALLLLAGLALVPADLLKAAEMDGAGAWVRLTRVTLPLMKPAILVALLFRTLDAFRIFDNIYVMTRGAAGTGSVSVLGYDNLFKAFNLGIGSAISVLIFACVALIAFVFVKVFGAAAPGSAPSGRGKPAGVEGR
jgi:multiple sugar transport system permease protein